MNSTNPIGCNPSGCSASRERKLQILQICKRYDILIIEGTSLHIHTHETNLARFPFPSTLSTALT